MNKKLFLVCNAHIDPVWLWEWPEGLAETLSTFRQAAEFCETTENFIFCHNEALLYQWIEEYDTPLFNRIKILVQKGKWIIIGGWYLQADCNLPSGESFVRQILAGKSYFKSRFGCEPLTAVNFDAFGHSRGLVQILARSGYDSYLFCRPDDAFLKVPDDFTWIGFDGSSVLTHRSLEHYNSERGKAADKISAWIRQHPDRSNGMVLWGIGNHGGGASKEDLKNISELQSDNTNWDIQHSHPEAYFSQFRSGKETPPKFAQDLNPWSVGCYTSMSRLKTKHRKLEHTYYLTEKMVSHAWLTGKKKYDHTALAEALEDLLFCEFHDILPGSGTSEVEQFAVQRMDHGLEILSRLQTRAFFALIAGSKKAKTGEFPVFVYNADATDKIKILTCELQGPEPNFNPDTFWMPEILDENGNKLEIQLEKESSNIANDHRKRIVFIAPLKGSSMNRFSCYLREVSVLLKPSAPVQGSYMFTNDHFELHLNPETGLIDQYKSGGVQFLRPDSGELLVMKDDANPWGMKVTAFRNLAGRFRLVSPAEAAELAGTQGPIAPVRIIEDGPIRSVVEAIFKYSQSSAIVHYIIPKNDPSWEMVVRLYWTEKDKIVKLNIPCTFEHANCMGEVACGVQHFDRQDEELIAHRWLGLFDEPSQLALTVINRTSYGFDFSGGCLRLSLLRSPAYAGHPVDEATPIVRQDRFTPRMDQGEHVFRFLIQAGALSERISQVGHEAQSFNEDPMILCVHPSGRGKKPEPLIRLSNPTIRVDAIKQSEDHKALVIRLFEPTGKHQTSDVNFPVLDLKATLIFTPFEIKTLKIDPLTHEICQTDLLEQPEDQS